MYHLPILSLREFLSLSLDAVLTVYPIEKILKGHEPIAAEILDRLPDPKILKHFERFLQVGAYPFYFEDPTRYLDLLSFSLPVILPKDSHPVQFARGLDMQFIDFVNIRLYWREIQAYIVS